MLTGVPREVQIVMTAIGYGAVGVAHPEPCGDIGSRPEAQPPVAADPLIDASGSPADARTTVDVSALWQLLGRLSSVEGENLMAGLAPETRAQLGRLAEVVAAAHGWH